MTPHKLFVRQRCSARDVEAFLAIAIDRHSFRHRHAMELWRDPFGYIIS